MGVSPGRSLGVRPFPEEKHMTRTTTVSALFAALLLSVGIAQADDMKSEESTEAMSDSMEMKDDAMMKTDEMAEDAMSEADEMHDTMTDDTMDMEDGMKKDDMSGG
jgi:pentapeptide MXKDX repeat protein